MAAELSILASSFLETKPESYTAFFLECIESKQHLNLEKIPDGWIGKVNSVCLLGITVEQCDTEAFRTNCSSWLRGLLQIIQTSKKSSVLQYCSKILDNILKHAAEFSELSRELSNSVLPSIISTLLANKCSDESSVLLMLSSCIRYFPGPSGPSRNQIEKFILPPLNSFCNETMKAACNCYALLPRCSRSGSGDKQQLCPWNIQWNKVLCTIHKLLDSAYENVEPVANKPSQDSENESLPLGDVPATEPDRTHTLVIRLNSLLHLLSGMIREEHLKVVAVPIDSTMNLLARIMNVTCNSLKSAVVVESVLLRASLPLIHTNAVDLLTTLITRCRNVMLPYCDLLIKLLVQELTWTKTQDPAYGFNKPYRKLRCSVYHCMEHWVQLTNSLPEEGSVGNKLMSLILDDIRPLTSQTKVNKRLMKMQMRVLHAEHSKEVQVVIVKLIIQCQQSSFNGFPIPYTSAYCRQALYHALLNCLLTNSPCVPPPVHHAARLFSLGLQDSDFKVSSFCQEALAVVNTIIHPRIFPQVCSALGPLQLNTSEEHANTTEMASSITFEHVMNTNWQSLSGESESNNGNHADYLWTNQIPMEQGEFGAREGGSMDNSFVIDVGNQTVQESIQNETSFNQSDKSFTSKSDRESQGNSGIDKSLADAGNTASQISTQPQNNESGQTVLSETLPDEDFGPSPQYARIFEPKRRKTDTDNCSSKERILINNNRDY
ncbi:hypothetical protein pdam_00003473 [Pocillopora damicornis]|uniref:Pre-rRNA-processing protein RIX1 N-terminal domain-containing protein n=1 Tax=Pocillopora damicornis TaxID=46731 RepID=A0A3M6V4K3_POCDA|nr:hypothetical protein pdam_00003473 [Pocillopora damicornis]